MGVESTWFHGLCHFLWVCEHMGPAGMGMGMGIGGLFAVLRERTALLQIMAVVSGWLWYHLDCERWIDFLIEFLFLVYEIWTAS
jgi:hypothetical protein